MNKIYFSLFVGLVLLTALGSDWSGCIKGIVAYDRGDYRTALRVFRPLAEQGNASAQHHLGIMHEMGRGVPRDHVKAAGWYKKAALQGVGESQFNLANMYYEARGIPGDNAEAAKWYRRAAEQGIQEAQNNLGFMYGRGEGVNRDYIQAYVWFALAGTTGNEVATKNREQAAGNLTPDQITRARAQAEAWLGKHRT